MINNIKKIRNESKLIYCIKRDKKKGENIGIWKSIKKLGNKF